MISATDDELVNLIDQLAQAIDNPDACGQAMKIKLIAKALHIVKVHRIEQSIAAGIDGKVEA